MSASLDENRPSALVAFSVVGSGAGPALDATSRAIGAAVGLHQGSVVRSGPPGEPRIADFREAGRAFAFALEALRMAGRYNERHPEAPIDVRVGVHHDTVWFVGEEAIGDALAVAVHLAGLAPAGGAIASAEALAALGNASAWELVEREPARVPGVDRPVPILEARPRSAAPSPRAVEASAAAPPREHRLPAADDRSPGRPAWMNIPMPPRPPSARTAGEEIVAGIAEIGRAVVNELVERSRNVDREKLRASALAAAEGWETRGRAEEGGGTPAEAPGDQLEQRKKRAAASAGRSLAGFVSHATSFVLIGGGLVALNVLIARGYPWAFFPVAGWGIGIVTHLRSVLSARRRARQLRALEAVSPEQLGLVEKIQRAERGFGGHTAAYLAVNGFLAGVNLITSAGFLWFLFPAVAWGIGYVTHLTGHLARKALLVRRLSAAGISWSDVRAGRRVSGGQAAPIGQSRVTADMEYADLLREARAIRDGLLARLAEHAEVGERMGSDVKELLTSYAEQLEKLVLRNHEFRTTLESLPEAELEREIADYRGRLVEEKSAALRQEYERAAGQAERQLGSVRELGRQKQILGVRIRSAFGLLKQLEIDFVRLKNAASSDELQGIASIRSKAHEITDYLEGLDEVERG